MSLFLNAADQREDRLVALNADLPPVRADEGAGTVAVVLDHAKNRDGDADGGKGLFGGRGVGVAAVDEQQVGQVSKLFITVLCPCKAAVDHLIHAGIIVGTIEISDTELAVIALERFTVNVHCHAGDNPCGTEV